MTGVLTDAGLPGVVLLGEPPRLREVLSRLLVHWLGPDGQLLDSRATVRHFRPNKRCSVELELVIGSTVRARRERRKLLGKMYRDDQGARVYETLQDLRNRGFAAGRFLVPQPIAYDAEYHLLALEWAEGDLLTSLLLTESDAGPAVERAAAWLVSLHRCGVTSGRRYTLSQHVQTLAGWRQQLTQVFPEGEGVLADLLGGIEERGCALAGWIPGPTHRDLTPDHLVVTGAQVVGLDFDEFCQYDPLFDVAHFTVHLRFLGLTRFGALTHFDRLADRFLAAYRAGGGEDGEERRRLYEAIAYFKLGRFVALVRRPQDWKLILPALLREALRLVEGYGT